MFGFGKKENRSVPVSTDISLMDFYTTFLTNTGSSLSIEDAVNNPTVHSIVKLISETIGSLPINIKHVDTKQIIKNDIYRLLKQPNSEVNSITLLTTLIRNLVQYGNGYLYVERDLNFKPIGLFPLMTKHMEVRINDLFKKEFTYTINGKQITYSSDNIIHIVGMSENGYVGKSAIENGKEAISLSNALEKYASFKFKNGINSKIILTIPNDVLKKYENDPDKAIQWMTSLERKISNVYSGIENSNKPIVLDGGIEVKELTGNDNSKDQLLELRQYQNREIAKLYNVPLHLIADLEKSSFNNISQQGQEFLEYCLRPWIERIEDALNSYLIPVYDRDKLHIEFDYSALLKADPAQRAEILNKLTYSGVISRNEARKIEGYPLLEQDSLLQPLNMINVLDKDQLKKAQYQEPEEKDTTTDNTIKKVKGK